MRGASWVEEARASLSGMGSWGVTAVRVRIILLVAWALTLFLQRMIRKVRIRIASRLEDAEAVKRAETLGRAFRYLVAVAVSLVAGVLRRIGPLGAVSALFGLLAWEHAHVQAGQSVPLA